MKWLAYGAAVALLLVSSVAHAQVLFPNRGGTGTTTTPSQGQVLVGQSNGTYGPQATGTLGFPSLSSFSAVSPLAYSGGQFSIVNNGVADPELAFDTGQHLTTASSPTFSGLSLSTLTVSGSATTTGNAYFGSNIGIGTSTPYRQLSVLTSSNQAASPFGIALADTSVGSTWSVSQPAASIDYVSLDGSGVGFGLRARFGIGMTSTSGSFSKFMFQLATSTAGITNNQMIDALTISQGSGYPRVWIGTTTSSLNRNFEVVGFDTSTTIASQSDASIAAMNISQTDGTFSELGFDTVNTSGTEVTTSKIIGVNTSHTAGSEGGDLVFLTKNAGTFTERLRVDGAGYLRVAGGTPTMMGTYSTGYTSPNLLTIRSATTTFSSSTAQIVLEGQRGAIVSGDMLGSIAFETLDTQLATSGVSPGTTTAAMMAFAEGTHSGSSGTSGLAFFTTSGNYNNFGEKVRISGAGNVGIGTTTPGAQVTVGTGDVYIASSTRGIILKSPDGTCARGTIDNSDVLTFASVTCP